MSWKPYTYRVTNKTTGLMYYGVKYGKDANPRTFWIDYFTSSKYVKRLIDEYGVEDFICEIRRTFDDVESAISWEKRVNTRFSTRNPNYLNCSFMEGRRQDGIHNGNYGNTMSEHSKRKAVKTRMDNGSYVGIKGPKHSEQQKKKMVI